MFVQIPSETTFRVLFYSMNGFVKEEASEIEKVLRRATKMAKNLKDPNGLLRRTT